MGNSTLAEISIRMLQQMKLKSSILNIYALLFLAWCIGYTLYNYSELSHAEGWGVVAMVGLFIFGVGLLIVDIAIRNLVKNPVVANIIGLGVSFIFTLMLIYGGLFS